MSADTLSLFPDEPDGIRNETVTATTLMIAAGAAAMEGGSADRRTATPNATAATVRAPDAIFRSMFLITLRPPSLAF
jgi:hypothetical protein